MKKISLAYFGSPDFAANFLERLLTDTSMYLPAGRQGRYIEVKLIVTQPDQLVGRKQILTPTPVKIVAEKYKITNNTSFPRRRESSLNIPFKKCDYSLDPLLRGDDKKITLNLELDTLKNIDLALVYAYGDLIPKEFLALPKYGFWNIHPSLLPKYRGPSPIAAPLINGDKTTGVTIIKMDEDIDHGPIIAQESLTIEIDDKRPDLEKKLTDLGFEMFKKLIMKGENTFFETIARGPLGGVAVEKNGIEPLNQNHKKAIYTKKLSKQDGFIEFEKLKRALTPSPYLPDEALAKSGSLTIYNLFRGLYPWPGLWTMVKPVQLRQLDEAKRLKITDMELVNGKIIIKKVQLEGKNEVDFETFNKAYKVF